MGALKRLGDLTVPDLRSTPVWRYEGGTGSEALVEPARRDTLSQTDDEIFLAATEFVLFDATHHVGYCFPADDSGLDYLQPAIVSDSGHVNFWFDEPAPPEVLSRQWHALGKMPQAVFPVDFQCLVPVDGRTVRGRIEGIESPHEWPSELPEPPAVAEPEAESPEVAVARQEGAEGALTARPIETRRKDPARIGKRTTRRRKTEMPVQFSQGPLQGTGVIGDISPRGMFVRSAQIPGTGPLLRLTVNLPGGRKLVLKGRVVRRAGASSSPASGFGLKLEEEWPDYERLFPGGPPGTK
jgi:PilZ domain